MTTPNDNRLPDTAQAIAGEVPDAFDIDGFQHAIINMDCDLSMGRMITENRVRRAEKAHDEIVGDLQVELTRLRRDLSAATKALQSIRDYDVAANCESGLETTDTQATAMWQLKYIAREALAKQAADATEGEGD